MKKIKLFRVRACFKDDRSNPLEQSTTDKTHPFLNKLHPF
jgi:hypothetical protein